ncbi:MAG: sugar transferase [Bacteroidales bacterium]|nr:sugar transferase [Bacteroidales bacterium]
MINKRLKKRYILWDCFAALATWFTFNIYRYNILPLEDMYGSFLNFISTPRTVIAQIVYPLGMMLVFYLSGYYNRVVFKSRAGEFVTTFISIAIWVLSILFFSLMNKYIYTEYNYNLVLTLFIIGFTWVYCGRCYITSVTAKRVHSGAIGFNTLVIGCSSGAVKLVESIKNLRYSVGYDIVGYVKLNGEENATTNLPAYNFEDLDEVISKNNIKKLIVAPEHNDRAKTFNIINSLYKYDLPIMLEAREYEILTSRIRLSDIYGAPFVDVSVLSLSDAEENIKRFCDIILSSIALIILSPLMLYVAIRIKLSSKGNIIYKQRRVGFKRKEFTMYKFRSMVENAEEETPLLSSPNDKRITKFGHWLRKYRIDELPQFWNVIKGDMSLVGPRPERKYFVDKIIERAPYYSLLHRVRPGITSWGMVNYGYARNIDEMIERLKFDIIYLENMSLLIDIKILFYTVKIVFTGRGM